MEISNCPVQALAIQIWQLMQAYKITDKSDIGCQFLVSLWSLFSFGKQITTLFLKEQDSSPFKYPVLIAFVIIYFNWFQNAFQNSAEIPSIPGDLLF